jgi:hypothetical protein
MSGAVPFPPILANLLNGRAVGAMPGGVPPFPPAPSSAVGEFVVLDELDGLLEGENTPTQTGEPKDSKLIKLLVT